jgi:hypothetical protein
VRVDGPGTLTATRTEPPESSSMGEADDVRKHRCSAGLKKQENWSENTRNELAEAKSTMRQADETWSQS